MITETVIQLVNKMKLTKTGFFNVSAKSDYTYPSVNTLKDAYKIINEHNSSKKG